MPEPNQPLEQPAKDAIDDANLCMESIEKIMTNQNEDIPNELKTLLRCLREELDDLKEKLEVVKSRPGYIDDPITIG
jgi:hypothetical protein